MSRPFTIVASLAVGLGAAAQLSPVAAQGVEVACRSYGVIAEQLAQGFAERPVAFGIQGDGSLLQIFASKTGETWTVVLTKPSGRSCIVAEGVGWESLPQPADGPVA
ncbi:MAG TPA: hypothetical protein VFG43_01165 [Geminicoccaceae bacterium]|nr:hypothetical protein [Geminicoccaceae bacterium]